MPAGLGNTRHLVAALVAALSLSACGYRPAQQAPLASVPPAPPETTVPAVSSDPPAFPDPAVVPADPAEIDLAYVQAVMDELDELYGVIAREAAANRRVTEGFLARMRALFHPGQGSRELQGWEQIGFQRVRVQPEPPKSRVLDVISATPSCIFAAVERDFHPVYDGFPDFPQPWYLHLEPVPAQADPADLNPTAWRLVRDVPEPDRVPPPDPCD